MDGRGVGERRDEDGWVGGWTSGQMGGWVGERMRLPTDSENISYILFQSFLPPERTNPFQLFAR